MNDNDLERRLRSESGPREQGYVPSPLPATLEPSPPAGRPSRALRLAVLAGAVGAGVLAVAVGSALMSGEAPNSGVGAGQTATPTASASPRQPTDCQAADVVLTAEPWGGAAGSRGTVVTVALADGRYPCFLQRQMGATVRDADGSTLVESRMHLMGSPVKRLDPGDSFTVGIAWSNWCGGGVAEPVSLSLWSPDAEFPVDVPAGADPIPPCLGENAESNLSVTQLQPAD